MPEPEGEHLIRIGGAESTWVGASARPMFERVIPSEPWTPNLERLYSVMAARGLDGLVVLLQQNVQYLAGYTSPNTGIRHHTEPAGAVVVSRREPDHPVMIMEAVDISHNLAHPSWIRDVRAYFTHLLPPDVPRDRLAFDRFARPAVKETEWGRRARETVADTLANALKPVLAELGLDKATIGFDNMTLAPALSPPDASVVDAYGAMKFIRQIKTPAEIERLRRAARLNEIAIENTVASWSSGMTWFEINHIYDLNCIALGGWVQYGGGIALSNADSEPDHPVFHPQYETEDFPIEQGTNIMLDCHGQLDGYRWDGGKTWIVDDERQGAKLKIQRACEEASLAVLDALRPGIRVHELQMIGREVFRKLNVPEADLALVFFHGMGLDHTDIEIRGSSATANWSVEENMTLATHIAYPGDARTRYYLEDVGLVTPSGGESLFTWDIAPHH